MSQKSAKRRAEFLGMSHGAASNRLRKAILFGYVQRAGDARCFRCGKQIEHLSDFSVEHKLPWENRDVALFWDLENIAFSHLSCNSGAAEKINQITVPAGMSWCTGCKKFHDVLDFQKATSESNNRQGLRQSCRTFESQYKASWRDRTGKH